MASRTAPKRARQPENSGSNAFDSAHALTDGGMRNDGAEIVGADGTEKRPRTFFDADSAAHTDAAADAHTDAHTDASTEAHTIGFLGPAGSYSWAVAMREAGTDDKRARTSTLIECADIGAVVRGVGARMFARGVVPLENSTHGVVDATLDALLAASSSTSSSNTTASSNTAAAAERFLPINHCLASPEPSIARVASVYAHPQSLGQTRAWCLANLPAAATRVPVASNSAAALRAAAEPAAAAICSEACARMYNLNILARSIQDRKDNTTRFLVLANAFPAPSGNDKSIVIVTIPAATSSKKNNAFSLTSVLALFHANSIPIIRIDSRPAPPSPSSSSQDSDGGALADAPGWGYAHFIEFRGHVLDARVSAALKEIRDSGRSARLDLHVLGSFAAAVDVIH